MRTVWKYQLPIEDEFTLSMPDGAELLHVESQFDVGCLWARVDPERGKVARSFRLRGTGHSVDGACQHVGSFILFGGTLVFHLFEVR